MRKLTVDEIVKHIEKGVVFEAEVADGSFYIRVDRYVPYVCTAIHDGNKLRPELKSRIAQGNYERWYEEDPHTGEFILALPIVLIGRDSRFEYDLNRSPEKAIYTDAWGQKVWTKSLTKTQQRTSLQKHANYYKVTHALINKLESLFDGCVVYDIHSYNYQRWDREVPLFNIGCERVDKKFDKYIQHWKQQLSSIQIDNFENETAINDVFKGYGYNLEYIQTHFSKTLVLATEIKKIYCNELTGGSYPKIIRTLRGKIKDAILANAHYFAQNNTNWEAKKGHSLLHANLEKVVKDVDKSLFQLVKEIELLNYVNPVNVEKEKRLFFKNKGRLNPSFRYKPVKIDPFTLKRKLHDLRVDKINDISIQNMYEQTINGYIDKIDMMASLGTDRFLYNSLRYFGKPSERDLKNAKYLLHLPLIEDESTINQSIKASNAVQLFRESLNAYGFDSRISITRNVVSDVMVLNRQKKILINEQLKLSPKELQYLIHHEIGVHMVTTMNSNLQPLKIFNVGLPVNTKTQEGLAVLAEYLSGNITLSRLKKIALRVIAVDMMCNGEDFKSTYEKLVSEYGMEENAAFTTTTRVFRGGGFTKDYLYLRGFREMLSFWLSERDIGPLLIGKTSLKYYNTLTELIDRGLIKRPTHFTQCFIQPETENNNPIFDYVISGII